VIAPKVHPFIRKCIINQGTVTSGSHHGGRRKNGKYQHSRPTHFSRVEYNKKKTPLHTRNGLSAFRRRVPGFYIQLLHCFPGKSPAFPLLHFATASVSLERGDAALMQMQ
jgi:hypothetical protein